MLHAKLDHVDRDRLLTSHARFVSASARFRYQVPLVPEAHAYPAVAMARTATPMSTTFLRCHAHMFDSCLPFAQLGRPSHAQQLHEAARTPVPIARFAFTQLPLTAGCGSVADTIPASETKGSHMLRRFAIIALLGILGLSVGYVSTWLGGHRYYIGTTLWLPRNSPHSAKELVAMTSGRHPGAQVRADGQEVNIEATGTILGADEAMRVAYREVVAANVRKFRFLPYYAHFADQLELTWGDPVHRGLVGLFAGISVALGFLVPPKSRVVPCPSCSRAIQRPRPNRGIAMPITLGIIGFAAASIFVVLAAFLFALYSRQYSTISPGL